ncbi:succinylglutamate desuccinylase/aspartoacylase family protein [Paraburkholderia sp. EG286B]|uniref:succinylglutamate desuccinylase/aspartoacylase family protein n=1 Tax=Paraburkholderia sp. EG286B TaxID=3237011 RepID=UPI0034D35CEB
MSVSRSTKSLRFSADALKDIVWSTQEIVADAPGPRLCIMTGVHVNEVAAIEAGFRLTDIFAKELKRGSVSVLSFANVPAVFERTEFNCPIDRKNINFCFPGTKEGTFSEVLADAILNEWASDADCLIDLHGGDLREQVSQFTVMQETGDPSFDAFNLELAEAFDPQFVMALPKPTAGAHGRSCTGRALKSRHAAFAEAGGNGVVDEISVAFHVDGVRRVAHLYAMTDDAPPKARLALVAESYAWIVAKKSGWCEFHVPVGDAVGEGQVLATIRDLQGTVIDKLVAQTTGFLLWRVTHPIVRETDALMGVCSHFRD